MAVSNPQAYRDAKIQKCVTFNASYENSRLILRRNIVWEICKFSIKYQVVNCSEEKVSISGEVAFLTESKKQNSVNT